MDAILGGKALVNGTDIWTEYGVFLAEKRRGDRNNLKAILSPAKTKTHVAVDIREENGEKYSAALSDKYGVCERTVYDLIRRLKAECNLLAV